MEETNRIEFKRDMTGVEQLEALLKQGERINLECKKAQGGIPGSLWETYSAFANTDGGIIVLGVEENTKETNLTKRFTIVGVDNADKIRRDFWNSVNNREKISVNLLSDNDVQTIICGGKEVILITVPRAENSLRPVYVNNNLFHGCFKRNHEGDYHCSEQMVRMMVRDSYDDGNDRMLIELYTMDDIDIPTLQAYRMRFSLANKDHVWNDLNDKDFLIQLGGYTINRQEGKEGLTMAGLLMFGKGLPVRERFDNLRMDYIDKSGLIGDQRYSNRITYDGRWENNIYNFLTRVVPLLTRDLPHPFKMEGIIRQDDTLQDKAVREAFTNMVIHADLLLNGLLRVEKFDDKYVFTNPGLLKLPLKQIYAGGESKARNQRMQNMLRMIGYGENIGSGFPLIISACTEKHWLKPELIEQPELMQVKLVLHIIQNNVTENETKDETKDETKQLSERQGVILDIIRKNNEITITEMRQKTLISVATLKRELAELQSNGIIRRTGGRKNGHWEVIQ